MPRGVYTRSPEQTAKLRAMMLEARAKTTPAARSEISRRTMARLNADAEFRAKAGAATAASNRSPERRDLSGRVFRAYYADPANNAAATARKRARSADPAYRAKLRTAGIKGVVARCGVFHCPPELRNRYRYLCSTIGLRRARAEIRALLRQRVLARVDYSGAGAVR